MSVLTNPNGFRPLAALRHAAADQRVQEIEGGGMDPGRVFIHLRPGWHFGDGNRTQSVGSAVEVIRVLRRITNKPL
jgi:hypothetical protein